ncbi:MAG: FAD-binding oxidoreductase, partial [Deltaproteobacteria bacterium]|nr:FAD-binding oxidoreductase [Deltaproteobacteria bacterium]
MKRRYAALLTQAFGGIELSERPLPRIEDLELRPPRFALADDLAAFCTDAVFDRANHTYGRAWRDVVRAMRGDFSPAPDYVAYPRNEADIAALMSFCAGTGVALIPFGGGSSVVGGVEPRVGDSYAGTIVCDLCRLDKVLRVDSVSRTVCAEAGIYGPDLADALRPHGLVLRHYPQSFEFSTLGGWIATRAGGHFATLYTHIDEFVQSVRMVTPRGIWETRELPGTGDGPDANRFVIGSEGIFGIITRATIRVQAIPQFRAAAVVRFDDQDRAVDAVRTIAQSGLNPANCRLISALEAFTMGIGDGARTVLLLGFESADHAQTERLHRALEIASAYGGERDEASAASSEGDPDAGATWKDRFIRAPYVRDWLARCGVITETFETATTWDRFATFHEAIMSAAVAEVMETCGAGFVFWRFTHVYADGPAIYYTVVAPGREGGDIAQWDAIKMAASDAIIANGGLRGGAGVDQNDRRSDVGDESGRADRETVRLTRDHVRRPVSLDFRYFA